MVAIIHNKKEILATTPPNLINSIYASYFLDLIQFIFQMVVIILAHLVLHFQIAINLILITMLFIGMAVPGFMNASGNKLSNFTNEPGKENF